jgi:hypothetical protein
VITVEVPVSWRASWTHDGGVTIFESLTLVEALDWAKDKHDQSNVLIETRNRSYTRLYHCMCGNPVPPVNIWGNPLEYDRCPCCGAV